jgi:hypothetical protein
MVLPFFQYVYGVEYAVQSVHVYAESDQPVSPAWIHARRRPLDALALAPAQVLSMARFMYSSAQVHQPRVSHLLVVMDFLPAHEAFTEIPRSGRFCHPRLCPGAPWSMVSGHYAGR